MDHPHLKSMRVVKYDCREFANRLWNDMAIYAAGLELEASVSGPSPLQEMPTTRGIYEIWAQFIGRVLHPKESMFAWGGTVRYLPPTTALPEKYHNAKTLYLLGMLFRNPAGFLRYEQELKVHFGKSKKCAERIEHELGPYAGKKRIGVEIRQRTFTYFPEGDFLIPLSRTREIVDEYSDEHNLKPADVVLVIHADRLIPLDVFDGYEIQRTTGGMKYRFDMLSSCDVIIGTNASLPYLASWFGNVPHVVTDTDPIDWPYYREHIEFFENKYATFTQKIRLH